MKTIALAMAIAAALAAAAFAWQRNQALDAAQAALAGANAQLQRTQADLKSVSAEIAPLRKEAAELKAAIEQQRAELASAVAFLDSERASAMRIREELTVAKEQIAYMSRSRAAQAAPAYSVPMEMRPMTPPVVRVVPSAGSVQGAAVRAR